jgi:hypothetical protein
MKVWVIPAGKESGPANTFRKQGNKEWVLLEEYRDKCHL